LTTEVIVVAVGSAVVGEDGPGVEQERAQVTDAAAHALAVRAVAIAEAADGLVGADVRGTDDHRAGTDVDAAAQAVAAVAAAVAVTAESSVMVDGGRDNG